MMKAKNYPNRWMTKQLYDDDLDVSEDKYEI